MKTLYFLAITALLSACTGMTDSMNQMAGLGAVTTQKSTFDGATVVSMSPNFLVEKGKWMANQVKLGARWLSTEPNDVYLVLVYESSTNRGSGDIFTSINGLDINIDGKISSYNTSGMTKRDSSDYDEFQRTFHTSSTNVVKIPMSQLQAMMAATDCRLRVRTQSGYEDSHFSVDRNGSGGAATARLTLREFLTKVEAART